MDPKLQNYSPLFLCIAGRGEGRDSFQMGAFQMWCVYFSIMRLSGGVNGEYPSPFLTFVDSTGVNAVEWAGANGCVNTC